MGGSGGRCCPIGAASGDALVVEHVLHVVVCRLLRQFSRRAGQRGQQLQVVAVSYPGGGEVTCGNSLHVALVDDPAVGVTVGARVGIGHRCALGQESPAVIPPHGAGRPTRAGGRLVQRCVAGESVRLIDLQIDMRQAVTLDEQGRADGPGGRFQVHERSG